MKRGDSETLLIDKQEIQTQITVNDGETIVLGGIFQQKAVTGLIKSLFWPIFLGWVGCLNRMPGNKAVGS